MKTKAEQIFAALWIPCQVATVFGFIIALSGGWWWYLISFPAIIIVIIAAIALSKMEKRELEERQQ